MLFPGSISLAVALHILVSAVRVTKYDIRRRWCALRCTACDDPRVPLRSPQYKLGSRKNIRGIIWLVHNSKGSTGRYSLQLIVRRNCSKLLMRYRRTASRVLIKIILSVFFRSNVMIVVLMATASDGVKIIVDDQQFWSSKSTLIKAPYFEALFRMNATQTELYLDRNPDAFRHVLSALRGYPCYIPIAFQERVNLIQEMMHFHLEDFLPAIVATFDAYEKAAYDALCESEELSKCGDDEALSKPRREFSLCVKSKSATTTQIMKQRRLW